MQEILYTILFYEILTLIDLLIILESIFIVKYVYELTRYVIDYFAYKNKIKKIEKMVRKNV